MKHNMTLKFLIHSGKGKPAGTNVSSRRKELSRLHLSFYNTAKVENQLLSKLPSRLSNTHAKTPHRRCAVRDGKGKGKARTYFPLLPGEETATIAHTPHYRYHTSHQQVHSIPTAKCQPAPRSTPSPREWKPGHLPPSETNHEDSEVSLGASGGPVLPAGAGTAVPTFPSDRASRSYPAKAAAPSYFSAV